MQTSSTPLTRGAGTTSARTGGVEECRCLLDARRQAEAEGRLDFAARLLVRSRGDGGVSIERRVETGEPYRIRRIQFQGHHAFGDLTLRRALVLDEGDPFDATRLSRSIVRLNRLGLLEEIGERSVRVVRDDEADVVDITFHVKDGPRGRWSFSGPVGTMSVGGPLSGSLMTRLPVLSTFNAAVSLMAFANPFAKWMPFSSNRDWYAVGRLERPYLIGQGWKSGFTIMPQAGWQGMAALYGMNQAQGRVMNWLRGDAPEPEPLAVAVERVIDEDTPRVALTLLCEPQVSKWKRVRNTAVFAAEIALALGLAGW
ncbi:MAG: POTRA domain-containing protein [Bryobacteraceae bacterium]|nr:POTRA domain-containing protein [Bryobacteraceae bacterium]